MRMSSCMFAHQIDAYSEKQTKTQCQVCVSPPEKLSSSEERFFVFRESLHVSPALMPPQWEKIAMQSQYEQCTNMQRNERARSSVLLSVQLSFIRHVRVHRWDFSSGRPLEIPSGARNFSRFLSFSLLLLLLRDYYTTLWWKSVVIVRRKQFHQLGQHRWRVACE